MSAEPLSDEEIEEIAAYAKLGTIHFTGEAAQAIADRLVATIRDREAWGAQQQRFRFENAARYQKA